MTVLVDTNVLIDIAQLRSPWHDWSRRTMTLLMREGLAINPVIFSEFCFRFDSFDDADRALNHEEFRREPLPWEASFAAAQAFRLYRQRGGRKERTLPDFLIGAHAVVRGYPILTRDPAGYRAYFPTLAIIAPDTHP